MKKIALLGIVILTGWASLPSCSVKHQAELSTIDSLRTVVADANNFLQKIDEEKVHLHSKEGQKKLDNILMYTKDTISVNTVQILAAHRTNFRSFKKLKTEISRLKNNVSYSNNQLETLSRDIKNDLLEADKIQKFLQKEKEGITMLYDKSKSAVEWYEREIKVQKTVIPPVDSIIAIMHKNGMR